MNQLNSIILEGCVDKDAELFQGEGMSVCRFVLAVSRNYRNIDDEEITEVSRFEIQVYGKTGEFCKERAKKGREVRIVGRLKEIDGKVFVIAEHLEYKSMKK